MNDDNEDEMQDFIARKNVEAKCEHDMETYETMPASIYGDICTYHRCTKCGFEKIVSKRPYSNIKPSGFFND